MSMTWHGLSWGLGGQGSLPWSGSHRCSWQWRSECCSWLSSASGGPDRTAQWTGGWAQAGWPAHLCRARSWCSPRVPLPHSGFYKGHRLRWRNRIISDATSAMFLHRCRSNHNTSISECVNLSESDGDIELAALTIERTTFETNYKPLMQITFSIKSIVYPNNELIIIDKVLSLFIVHFMVLDYL